MDSLGRIFNKKDGLRGKKITVVGAAKSGIAASNLLVSKGADVTVTDTKEAVHLKTYLERLDRRVKTSLGGHPPDIFTDVDMIVISPGVPMDIKPLSIAIKNNIPVISELELAYNTIDIPFVAITGTNGKSTTTMLIGETLKEAGLKILVGGNIGNALTEEILTTHDSRLSTLDYVVAEVSSFQLEGIKDFKPHIACILNITPDHLDRYKDMDEYTRAKSRIFVNQDKDDFLILNADDPILKKVISEKLKVRSEGPKVLYFSQQGEVDGVYFKDGVIYGNSSYLPLPTLHFPLISQDEIRIKGIHNIENAMAAITASMLTGIDVKPVRETLKEFNGLEHRIEFVSEINGVTYINDSKGTNVGAVVKSILSFTDPVILIAGGADKGCDFTILRELVRGRVKAMVLIGEAKDKIKATLGDLVDAYLADSMDEAVKIASVLAVKGDVVLLSPACASFDMFKDYEDRGRQFKESVKNLNAR